MHRAVLLLAEDDAVVALDLAQELEAAGLAISGIAHSVKEAMRLIERQTADIALLNVSLRDGDSYPVARRLRALGIPFVFLTSFSRDEIHPEFRDAPHLPKPQAPAAIAAFVAEMIRTVAEAPVLSGGAGSSGLEDVSQTATRPADRSR